MTTRLTDDQVRRALLARAGAISLEDLRVRILRAAAANPQEPPRRAWWRPDLGRPLVRVAYLVVLVALLVCGNFIVSPPAGNAYHQVLWTWLDVAGFAPTIGFYLDAVSITWVP